MRLVRQGCILLFFLHVLTLESPLQNLEALRGISHDLECGRCVLGFVLNITVVVSGHKRIEMIEIALRDYEAVSGATINREKSMDLRHST